ncbi:hypothetical protein BJ944DRAFT_266633 [Cunninghamella echinulata]|nr:hypothetical protein BJ944DRAFT_266633 [Cunninghamella echinulata]
MLIEKKTDSFVALFELFKNKHSNQSIFSAACGAFLIFEKSNNLTERLLALYILYSYYTNVPLTQNPFLVFFLEFIGYSENSRGNWIEKGFVYFILEESINKLDQSTPLEVSQRPELFLPISQLPSNEKINYYKWVVIKLTDDPYAKEDFFKEDYLNGNQDLSFSDCLNQVINSKSRLDNNVINFLGDLLNKATIETLTIPETEMLNHALQLHPYVIHLLPLSPHQLPNLIEMNHILAVEIVPDLLNGPITDSYLHFLSLPPVTCNSLEVIHHVLTSLQQTLPGEFLHTYVSSAIRTCELLEGIWQEKQVRTLAKFLQSLLDRNILPISDYMIEIQSFCLDYLKIRGVATLFRTVTH